VFTVSGAGSVPAWVLALPDDQRPRGVVGGMVMDMRSVARSAVWPKTPGELHGCDEEGLTRTRSGQVKQSAGPVLAAVSLEGIIPVITEEVDAVLDPKAPAQRDGT